MADGVVAGIAIIAIDRHNAGRARIAHSTRTDNIPAAEIILRIIAGSDVKLQNCSCTGYNHVARSTERPVVPLWPIDKVPFVIVVVPA